jgi:hypothetical protein
MKIYNKPITKETINERNAINKQIINGKSIDSTMNQSTECDYCHFLTPTNKRIGGSAMTTANCAICQKSMLFCSTVTDVICPSCSLKEHVCSHCGSDRSLLDRS